MFVGICKPISMVYLYVNVAKAKGVKFQRSEVA